MLAGWCGAGTLVFSKTFSSGFKCTVRTGKPCFVKFKLSKADSSLNSTNGENHLCDWTPVTPQLLLVIFPRDPRDPALNTLISLKYMMFFCASGLFPAVLSPLGSPLLLGWPDLWAPTSTNDSAKYFFCKSPFPSWTYPLELSKRVSERRNKAPHFKGHTQDRGGAEYEYWNQPLRSESLFGFVTSGKLPALHDSCSFLGNGGSNFFLIGLCASMGTAINTRCYCWHCLSSLGQQ